MRRLSLCALVGLSVVSPGCRSAGKAVEAGGEGARKIVRDIDVTGTAKQAEARTDFLKAAAQRLQEIDVDALNAAIAELKVSVTLLNERLAALSPEDWQQLQQDLSGSLSALREQLEGAPIQRASTAVLNVAETIDAKAKVLELDRVNELLRQAGTALEEVRAAVQQLDQNLKTAVDETRAVLVDLPTEELRETAAELQEAVGELRDHGTQLTQDTQQTLATVRIMAQVATVALGILGLGGVVWLVRGLGGRRH